MRLLDPDFLHWHEIWSYVVLHRFEEAFSACIAFLEQCGSRCDREREALERGWAEGGWEESLRAWLEVASKIDGYYPFIIADRYVLVG